MGLFSSQIFLFSFRKRNEQGICFGTNTFSVGFWIITLTESTFTESVVWTDSVYQGIMFTFLKYEDGEVKLGLIFANPVPFVSPQKPK